MKEWYEDTCLMLLRDEIRDLDFTRNSGNFVKAYVLGRIDFYINEESKMKEDQYSSLKGEIR